MILVQLYVLSLDVRKHLRIVSLATLVLQFWGKPDLSPPGLGDLEVFITDF